MTELSPHWLPTSSGRVFDFNDPRPEMIDAAAIAHELALQPRWNGNLDVHYSIGHHSLLVAEAITRPEWRIYGLLHDAPEYVTGDIIAPFKAWLQMNGVDVIGLERRIFNVILAHFGLPLPTADIARAVDDADRRVLATEYRDVVKGKVDFWKPDAPPLPRFIRARPWPDVETAFLEALSNYLEIARAA